MYPTRKARNDAPVRMARKTLAQAGTRTISATTNAQTRTVVMMIAGRSGVDLYAGAFSARCSPAEPSKDMLVSPANRRPTTQPRLLPILEEAERPASPAPL